MFAAHLAAGLAIKGIQPKAPSWAVLSGVFLPDLFWVGLAGIGVEPAGDTTFFDGWSHSVMSIIAQAAIFAMSFYRFGLPVVVAVGLAVLSHLPLDALIHPKPLELWPHASLAMGLADWSWAQKALALGKSRYWWIQLAIIMPLLVFYGWTARRWLSSNLIGASALVILSLHLVF